MPIHKLLRRALQRSHAKLAAAALFTANTAHAIDGGAPDARSADASTDSAARPIDAPAMRGSVAALDAWPAIQATARDGVVYAVSEDTTAVFAVSLATQRVLWRTAVRRGPLAPAEVTVTGPTVLLARLANELVAIDRSSGRIVARHPSASGTYRTGHVTQENGACAVHAECSLAPVDCATGAPIGAPLIGPTLDIHDAANSTSFSSCMMDQRTVIGAVGEASLYLVSANAIDSPRAEGTYLLARHRTTGRELFRARTSTSTTSSPSVALSVDRSLAFVGLREARGQLRVRALRTSNGAQAWTWTDASAARDASEITFATSARSTSALGVLVRAQSSYSLVLLDAQRGRLRWKVSESNPVVPLLADAVLSSDAPLRLPTVRAASWRDLNTGREQSRTLIPTNATLQRTADGLHYELTSELRGYDTNGAEIPRTGDPMVFDVVRATPQLASGTVIVRRSSATVATFSDDCWWLGETRVGSTVIAAIFQWRRQSAGSVRLFRATLSAPSGRATP